MSETQRASEAEAFNKIITPDTRWQYFGVEIDGLVNAVDEIQLNSNVPEEIQGQITICKKLCVYSYFVYEFVTIAMERSFMVIESALKSKYKLAEGKSADQMTLGPLLDWATKYKILDSLSSDQKEAMRHLRNSIAHPKRQQILAPGQAIGILEKNIDLINSIFSVPKAMKREGHFKSE